jgi:death-on-curing protein
MSSATKMPTMVIFLDANGFVLKASVAEETAMVLRAAAGEITEDEWIGWVTGVVAKNLVP